MLKDLKEGWKTIKGLDLWDASQRVKQYNFLSFAERPRIKQVVLEGDNINIANMGLWDMNED